MFIEIILKCRRCSWPVALEYMVCAPLTILCRGNQIDDGTYGARPRVQGIIQVGRLNSHEWARACDFVDFKNIGLPIVVIRPMTIMRFSHDHKLYRAVALFNSVSRNRHYYIRRVISSVKPNLIRLTCDTVRH